VYGKNKMRAYDFSPAGAASVTNLIEDEAVREVTRRELGRMQRAYIGAFASGTPLGDFTEQRDIVLVEEGTVFLHGGINPRVFEVSGGLTDLESLLELNEEYKANADEGRLPEFMKTLHGQIV
jgi:hypothetical protein